MSLPEPYQSWMHELGIEAPEEEFSTCASCAMCEGDGLRFEPSTKCCTYQPRLPNYQVGFLLSEAHEEHATGIAQVLEQIRHKRWITPLALERDPSRQLSYGHLIQQKVSFFGRVRAFRCSYYDQASGGCGIWRHREPVCSTWFCKHTRGALGKRFWKQMGAFLLELDDALSRHCLLELGLTPEALEALEPPTPRSLQPTDFDGHTPELYDAIWGPWQEPEIELYKGCAEIASGLSAEDVLQIGGSRLALRLRVLRLASREHQDRSLPDKVTCSGLAFQRLPDNYLRLATYSEYDPLDLPGELLQGIQDAQQTPVDELLRREHFDREMLLMLLDFGILQPG